MAPRFVGLFILLIFKLYLPHMLFHPPELPDNEIIATMEHHGYTPLEPSINPQDLQKLCKGDPLLEQVCTSMLSYCRRYAHDVFEMLYEQKVVEDMRIKGEDTQEAFQELKELDERRHRLHDAMIDSVNLVSRKLAEKGKDIEWIREIKNNGRAGYATFALLTFYKMYSRIELSSLQ